MNTQERPQQRNNKLVFAHNLNSLLKEQGKKQIDLHRDLGIPKSTITGYVKGTSLPNSELAGKLAEYFGVSKSDLDPRFIEESESDYASLSKNQRRIAESVSRDISDEDTEYVIDLLKVALNYINKK